MTIRLHRRAFLQLAGVSAANVFLWGPVSAARRGPHEDESGPAASPSDDVIGQLASSLGSDADRIFRFVSDEIRYQPYVGALRGARGTLSGRAGNAADQAALLAALLEASGIPHRFAWGAIDGAAAGAIAASAIADGEAIRRESLNALLGVHLGPGPGATPSGVERTAPDRDAVEGAAAGAVAWMREQLVQQVATIESALEDAGIELPAGFTDMPARERDQHVWVQVASGEGWLDLDPSLPGGAPGEVIASAASASDALPLDLVHAVEITVVVEKVVSGSLQETPVLTVTEDATRLAGQSITFLNTRPERLGVLVHDISGSLEGTKTYTATLVVGDDAYVGGIPFGVRMGGGLLDPLGGAGPQEGDTTAEWLQVTIRSPDAEPVVVRRTVFDRIGPAARANGTLDLGSIRPVELMDLGADLSAEYLPAQTQHWLSVSTGPASLDDIRRSLRPGDDVDVWVNLVHLYEALTDAAGYEVAVPAGVRIYRDAPNVAGFTIATRSAEGAGPLAEFSLDIWHRSYGQLPVSGVAPQAAPAATAGVLAHVVERVLLGDALRSTSAAGASASVSVGAVFDEARRAGIGIRVVEGPAGADGLAYPADAIARLRQSLGDGWLAICPERSVMLNGEERVGWWLFDPASGRTADQLDNGGGEIDEYAITLTPRQVAAEAVLKRSLFRCIASGVLAAVAGLLIFDYVLATITSESSWAVWFGGIAVPPVLEAGGALRIGLCLAPGAATGWAS